MHPFAVVCFPVDPGMHICEGCEKRDAVWRLDYLSLWYIWLCEKCYAAIVRPLLPTC